MPSVDSLSIQITASSATAKSRVLELTEALNGLVGAINQLDTSKIDSLANSVNHLATGMSALKGTNVRTIRKIADGLKDVSTKGESAFAPIQQGAEAVAEETAAVSTSVEKVNEDLQRFDATPLEDVAGSAEKVSQSIDVTANKMSGFKTLLSNLKIIIPTEDLDRVNKKIDKLKDKVTDLQDKLNYKSATQADYVDSDEMEKDQKQIQALINEIDRLMLKKQQLESHGGFKLGWTTSFSDIGRSITTVSKKLNGLASKFHFASKATNSTTKSTNDFKLASDRLVKSLTKVTRMLRLMVLRMALRTVIKEVGNGFKSLALHSEEFDNAMSNLRNSAKTLGYSFSAMVAPLLQALAPAIIYIINLLMKLLNAINQVFAALSGSKTWNKAKDFTGKWSDDIKAANKNAKELKKTVLGFDELNQLQDNKSSGGDTSNNIEDMFETVEIEGKWQKVADYIKNLAKKLFDPIKKAWEKVGDFVKSSWKYAMDEVYKLGASIARDFWKVWEQEETQKIFENILKIIGWIGQTVGNLARQFRKAWDENDTGLHILENIRDIILIITDHVEKMAKATAEWAAELDFSPILTKFNEWLESLKPVVDNLMGIVEDFYTTVILPLGKWAVEDGGPQLLQVFIDFNNKVDWEGLREKLKTLWEHLEPFAQTVGEGLIMFIDRVAQALADFINSKEFEDFLKTIEDWMDKVTPQDVADGLQAICQAILGFAAVKAVLSVLSAVAGFITTVKACAGLLKLAIIITVAYEGFKFGSWIGKMITGDEAYDQYTIPVILDFIVEGIPDSWSDFVDTIEEVAQAWADMLTEANAFISALTSLVSGPFITNLLTAAKDLQKLFKWKSETPDVSSGFLGSAGGELGTYMKNAQDASEETKKLAKEFEGLNAKANSTAESAKNVSSKVQESRTSFDNVKTSADNLKVSYDSIKTSLDVVTQNTPVLTQKQKDLADTFKNTASVEPTFTSAQKKIEESLKNVGTETDKLATTTKVDWSNIPIDVANAQISMSGTLQTMSLDTNNAATDITKSTDEIKKSFDEKSWTFSGVADGLEKTFKEAKSKIKSVWNSIADKLNGEYELGGGKFKIKLPTFAYGGFPEEDGLFLANHTEMVGKFSNGKTAVANNAEIVEGISQGVYSAVSAAMSQNSSGSGYIANTIVVDGEVIARTVTKAQNKQNMRYSPQMV